MSVPAVTLYTAFSKDLLPVASLRLPLSRRENQCKVSVFTDIIVSKTSISLNFIFVFVRIVILFYLMYCHIIFLEFYMIIHTLVQQCSIFHFIHLFILVIMFKIHIFLFDTHVNLNLSKIL